MSYHELATQLYHQLVSPSAYVRVIFHPDNFASVLGEIHRRMNNNYSNYSLKINEIDWKSRVFPELQKYARTVDPNSNDRAVPLKTTKEGNRDVLQFMETFLEHDLIESRFKFENFLRDQTGEYAHRANFRIGPYQPISHPMMEQTSGGILEAQDELDDHASGYATHASPFIGVMDRAKKVQAFTDSYTNPGYLTAV